MEDAFYAQKQLLTLILFFYKKETPVLPVREFRYTIRPQI